MTVWVVHYDDADGTYVKAICATRERAMAVVEQEALADGWASAAWHVNPIFSEYHNPDGDQFYTLDRCEVFQ